MFKTYNIISVLLDYPSQELIDSLPEVMNETVGDGLLFEEDLQLMQKFVDYASSFKSLHDWQAAYTELFDTATKTNLYLFDLVYGTSTDRGQAMVDLKEEYLKAGLMPPADELPDYLPMYLQYVAMQPTIEECHEALVDIHGVLKAMDEKFLKTEHPYEPLIAILVNNS